MLDSDFCKRALKGAISAQPFIDHNAKGILITGGAWMGFNLFATANNHSLDYEIEGLRIHRRVLQEAGAVFAGTGENLGEARAPGYLETRRGRVALISCASTFSARSPAGAQRQDARGRPGLNPLSPGPVRE